MRLVRRSPPSDASHPARARAVSSPKPLVARLSSLRAHAAQLLRRRLEATTRDWVFVRRLPRPFGSVGIYVSPSAGLKYLFRSMNDVDPTLLRLAHDIVKPGDTVWDVGANVGLFSFAAASRSGLNGRVVAFEPDTWLADLLRRSAARNSTVCADVTVLPVAVADAVGIRSFNILARSRAQSALAGYGYNEPSEASRGQAVLTVNLDWALEFMPPPDVVKIDVEAAEMEVLKGASRLIASARPVIICEVGADNQHGVTQFLQGHDYLIYDAEDRAAPRIPKQAAPWNTLAIPK